MLIQYHQSQLCWCCTGYFMSSGTSVVNLHDRRRLLTFAVLAHYIDNFTSIQRMSRYGSVVTFGAGIISAARLVRTHQPALSIDMGALHLPVMWRNHALL